MRNPVKKTLPALAWACAATVSALFAVPAHAADGAVCFFEHTNYQGASFCATANNGWVGGSWNDKISSVRVPSGSQVTLFEHSNYAGRSLTLKSDTANLVPLNFNDVASSFKLSTGSGSSELDAKCTPTVELALEDKARGSLFLDVSGANPEGFMQDIGRKVCRTLYKNPGEIRNATHAKLIIRNAPGEVAWKSGEGADITVMISTDHLQNVKNSGRDVGAEIKGILFHEMTHMYQQDDSDGHGADGGLIEGIADTVRFKNGFIPDGAQPNPNGHWNDGYRTTAFLTDPHDLASGSPRPRAQAVAFFHGARVGFRRHSSRSPSPGSPGPARACGWPPRPVASPACRPGRAASSRPMGPDLTADRVRQQRPCGKAREECCTLNAPAPAPNLTTLTFRRP